MHRKTQIKKFYEEIAPLKYLANFLNVESIRFTNDLKENLSYDAIFTFKDRSSQKVEVTCAIDDKQLPLKKEHFRNYGYVSASVDVRFNKVKNKKEITQQHRFMTGKGEDKREKILSLIRKSFEHKENLNRESYKNAILLIVVDTDGTNIIKLKQFLKENIHDVLKTKGTFDRIFLISRNPLKYDDLFMEI